MSSSLPFHPAVNTWFKATFAEPTAVQQQTWPAIQSGQHVLLAAATGSGKTLAAFLFALDRLIREGLEHGLPDVTRILYISPLKALSNDIQHNLQAPLTGISAELARMGLPDVALRAWVRTGDTPQSERAKAKRCPPHILVTTPESVYILLTSVSGRNLLAQVDTVIIDEIHALAGNKRGAHLALSLERLEHLTAAFNPHRHLQRIGLSATQKPIDLIAHFLVGKRTQRCKIIDIKRDKSLDLAIELPDSPLQAVMSNAVWETLYAQLERLICAHRTTLVFVNTRRLAERASGFLAARIGEENVTAHHGSMAKKQRLAAEQRLKNGDLMCLVATASLELGIDIGDIDLVCQLGSPRSISAFLQRVGRSGHHVGGLSKGRLFPLSRDDLVESVALLSAARSGELDRIRIPEQPLDVLAQQIIAEVGAREWATEALYHAVCAAWPYRHLQRATFDAVINMLANGYATRRGRRAAYLHHDAVNGCIKPRRHARLTALTNGGVIPDQFDYDVILMPEGLRVGSLGEDFAFESLVGDIFQLGNMSYRVLKVEQGKVLVEDAKGQPPNIPFWFGEAPGRSDELSRAVSTLRTQISDQLCEGPAATVRWLCKVHALSSLAAEQLTEYLGAAKTALGGIPTQENLFFERFFDASDDMHLVIHSPYGSRINRAWGLALRKRFCRKFNFELQAAALEDCIVLSLSATHSFPLEESTHYVHSSSVREVLIQALLAAPMFPTRWRWNATIALAVIRNRNGKRTPPYFQRTDAEDLIAVVFPDQIACGENIAGDREVPEHPLVDQSVHDCLHETMDIDGLIQLLKSLEQGTVKITCRDLTTPSPLAQEILTARPYAFLDDAPAEERSTMAVQSGVSGAQGVPEYGQLDLAAIEQVREEAWPNIRTEDELHDALVVLGFLTQSEMQGADNAAMLQTFFANLQAASRATQVTHLPEGLWVAAERLADFMLAFPALQLDPVISAPLPSEADNPSGALQSIIRSRMEGLGVIHANALGAPLGLHGEAIEQVLLALEQEGFVVRGALLGPDAPEAWCERRLLARIHRYTLKRLRRDIEAVSVQDYMRFLFHWHGLTDKREGHDAVAAVIQQLEGFAVPAGGWERDILSARIAFYTPDYLDRLCTSGRFMWLRLAVTAVPERQKNAPIRSTPIMLIERSHLPQWRTLSPLPERDEATVSAHAETVFNILEQHGASFFADLIQQTGLLSTQLETALGELVNWGWVTADHFAGLRALIMPANRQSRFKGRRGRPQGSPFDTAGRWGLCQNLQSSPDEAIDYFAWVLLHRYGVVFRALLERESVKPLWRDLLRAYWRMEARGEIRGGRFVQGVSGEQFAHPDAVSTLRKIRRQPSQDTLTVITAADPLNLMGVLPLGEKPPASRGTRIVFRHGLPIAIQSKQALQCFEPLDDAVLSAVKQCLTAPHWR